MIVWQGRGAIVAAVAFGSLLVSELLSEAYFHDQRYYQQHGWPKSAGFLVAAGIVRLMQRGRDSAAIEVANRHIEEEGFLRPTDELFFVSVTHWPLILCALGVIFYFVRE